MSSIASFFSAVFASEPVHNEAPAAEESNKEVSVEKSEASGDDAPAEEEAEEEEPEDVRISFFVLYFPMGKLNM